MSPGFGSRLMASITRRGNLCAGIDPHPSLLEDWGLPDSPEGLQEFSDRALEGVADVAAIIKPQSAFYERHGSRGIAVLEALLENARSAGVLTILDAKRGDIGSTMDAYAQAYLAEGSPSAPDALTISPYLGFGSLRPAVDMAMASGRGVFVLCLTSNPEGVEVQQAEIDGVSVARQIANRAAEVNRKAGEGGIGSVGLVVGVTVASVVADAGVDLEAINGPILVPGFGAQGGDTGLLAEVFGGVTDRAVVSSARQLLGAGPDSVALRSHAEATRDLISRGLSTG